MAMRLAIALAKNDPDRVYPGPFGHAPRFAIYEVEEGEVRLVEVRENPYAAMEGGRKHELMRAQGRGPAGRGPLRPRRVHGGLPHGGPPRGGARKRGRGHGKGHGPPK